MVGRHVGAPTAPEPLRLHQLSVVHRAVLVGDLDAQARPGIHDVRVGERELPADVVGPQGLDLCLGEEPPRRQLGELHGLGEAVGRQLVRPERRCHPELAPTRRADLDRHAEIPNRDVDLQHRCVRGDTHGHLGGDTGVVDRHVDPAPGERGHRGAELVGRAIGHRPRHGEAVDVGPSRGDPVDGLCQPRRQRGQADRPVGLGGEGPRHRRQVGLGGRRPLPDPPARHDRLGDHTVTGGPIDRPAWEGHASRDRDLLARRRPRPGGGCARRPHHSVVPERACRLERTGGAGDGAPGQRDLRLGGGLGRRGFLAGLQRVAAGALVVRGPSDHDRRADADRDDARDDTPTPPAPAHGPGG